MKNKKNMELLELFNDLINNIEKSDYLDNDDIFKTSENRIIYGKEGSGKSTHIMKNILSDKIQNNVVYISPSTKQSIEKYETFKKLIIDNNKTNEIKAYNLISQSEICRKLLSSTNETIMNILKNKQENLFEMSIYNINNKKEILDKNFIFKNCKSLTLNIENKTKKLFNTNEIIVKLISYISSSIHNKDFKSNIIIPIKIYNEKYDFKETTDFGRTKEDKVLLFNDDINKYINDIFMDPNNKESIIYDVSEKLSDDDIEKGNKLYIVYISNRSLKYSGKEIENSLKITENILKRNYNNKYKNVYFIEYFNFYNKIIEPLLNKIINNLEKLNQIPNNEFKIENIDEIFYEIKSNIINKLKNFTIINDELPVNISNLVSIDDVKEDNQFTNITTKKIDEKIVADVYFEKNKKSFKSKPYLNIEKINKYKILFNKLNNIFKNNIYINNNTYDIYVYLKNIFEKRNLNYLFTIFNNNVTILTSELLPTILLNLYEFKVYNMPDNKIKINENIKANILLLKNKKLRTQKSNIDFINNYINLIKAHYQRKDKHLFVGQKIFDTDITIQSLKGSNDIIIEKDKLKYESVNIFVNPNPPDIGFMCKLLFKDAIENLINNDNNKTDKMFFKKIKNRIKNNDNIINEFFSHIKYSDDINQALGRILGKRSEIFKHILSDINNQLKINCFMPIVTENNNINLTQLTLNKIKTRFNEQVNIIFDEESILNEYETLNKIKQKEDYKLINANRMLEISINSIKFNQTNEILKNVYGLDIDKHFNLNDNNIINNKIKKSFLNFKKLKLFNSEKTLYLYDIMKKLNCLLLDVDTKNVTTFLYHPDNEKIVEKMTEKEKEELYENEIERIKNDNLVNSIKINEMNNKLDELRKKYILNTDIKKDHFLKIFKSDSPLNKLLNELENTKTELPQKIKDTMDNINKDYICKTIIEKFIAIRFALFISLLKLEFENNYSCRKDIYNYIELNSKYLKEEYGLFDLTIFVKEIIENHPMFYNYNISKNKGIYYKQKNNDKERNNTSTNDDISLINIIKKIEENYNNLKEIKEKKKGYYEFEELNSNKYNIETFKKLKHEYRFNSFIYENIFAPLKENIKTKDIIFDKEKYSVEKSMIKDENELIKYVERYHNLITRNLNETLEIGTSKSLCVMELLNNLIFRNKWDNIIFDVYNKYTKTLYINNNINLSENDFNLNELLNNRFITNFSNINIIGNEYKKFLYGEAFTKFDSEYANKQENLFNYENNKKIIEMIENDELRLIESLKIRLFNEIDKYNPEYIYTHALNGGEISLNDTIIHINFGLADDEMRNNFFSKIFNKYKMHKHQFNNDKLDLFKNTSMTRVFNLLIKGDTYCDNYYNSIEERNSGKYVNTENMFKNIKTCFSSLTAFNTSKTIKKILDI